VFWNKDDECGSVLTTDNGFEEDDAFLQSDSVFADNDGNVLPLKAPQVPIRKGCAVQVGHAVVPVLAPCKLVMMILPVRTLVFDRSKGVQWHSPTYPVRKGEGNSPPYDNDLFPYQGTEEFLPVLLILHSEGM